MAQLEQLFHTIVHLIRELGNSYTVKNQKEEIMANMHPKNVTRAAIEGLVKKLSMPALDSYSQDWEYEVADSSRVSEFVSFYENGILNDDEKFALMIIIITSYNDALSEGNAQSEVWDKVKYHLLNEINIHKNTIVYWSLEGDELEDCFEITPLMRELLNVVESNKDTV